MNIIERIKSLLGRQSEEYHKPLTDEEFVKWHDDRYAELSPEIRRLGVAILRAHIVPVDANFEFVRKAVEKHGHYHWVTKEFLHFSWGMEVRNLLREYGLTDDLVPTGNLDDYYSGLLEEAAGAK